MRKHQIKIFEVSQESELNEFLSSQDAVISVSLSNDKILVHYHTEIQENKETTETKKGKK